MSQDTKPPELAAGDDIVRFCPLNDCGAKFAESVAANIEHSCPACGRSFKVMVK